MNVTCMILTVVVVAAAVPSVKTDTERICRKTKHSVKVFGGDFVNPAFMVSTVKAMLLSYKLVRNSYLDRLPFCN